MPNWDLVGVRPSVKLRLSQEGKVRQEEGEAEGEGGQEGGHEGEKEEEAVILCPPKGEAAV